MWSNRSVKRNLSVYEKRSLPAILRKGSALILPGTPEGEFEELKEVGYSWYQIQGVENNPLLALRLREHYYDTLMLYETDIEDHIVRTKHRFSYVHLDYCGHLPKDRLGDVQVLRDKLMPEARVRVTTLAQRRGKEQKAWENDLRLILINMCKQAKEGSGGSHWDEHISNLLGGKDDSTLAVGTMALLNYVFGISVASYQDHCSKVELLPAPMGEHRIAHARKFRYQSENNTMFTIWFDLVPTTRGDWRRWLPKDLDAVMSVLAAPCPEFIPALYKVGPTDEPVQIPDSRNTRAAARRYRPEPS